MLAAIGVAMLGGMIAMASSASAHTNSHEATCSTVSVTLARYVASTTGTVAIDEWYSWKGGQSDSHPFPIPSSNWQLDQGHHNGLEDSDNKAFQVGHGENSSWFYHKVVSGTPAHVNHVSVWINASLVADQDFSVSYSHTFDFPDKYATTNTYRVAVTKSVDGIGIFDTGTLNVAACERTAVEVTPTPPEYKPATCDAQGSIDLGESRYYEWVLNTDTGIYTAVPKNHDGKPYTLSGKLTFGPAPLGQLTGEACVITVLPPVYVAPTCSAIGTLSVPPPIGYRWEIVDGIYTAVVVDDNYTLTGAGPFGPFPLAQLTGGACVIAVLPPVYVAPTCSAIGTLTVPDPVGYRWTIETSTGKYLAVVNDHNYTLIGAGPFGPFPLAMLTGTACPVVPQVVPQVVPPVAPPAVAPPAVVAPPAAVLGVVKDATVAAPVVAGVVKDAPAVKTLAFTGAETVPLSLSGLLALLLGAALTVASRRQGGKEARE